jgi:hypothetical protein
MYLSKDLLSFLVGSHNNLVSFVIALFGFPGLNRLANHDYWQ